MQGLQAYLEAVLKEPLLASSVELKKFLDPANYSENFYGEAADWLAGLQNNALTLCTPTIAIGNITIHKNKVLEYPILALPKKRGGGDITETNQWPCAPGMALAKH